ncbi:hypothetical protein [Haloferax volcanii]|uniref:GATase domain protein n=3 Tax=Haloferax volcanii TaxID=2246 RepID=A0A384LP79_HALVD|nr:hypothetical protein [Haloferax volcanii]ADE04805.1 GATase domain protein [Haloferax volcanii DS2]ELY34503.1 hypothetical protein C498_05226 [Haloferax volcanii DS2]MBS8119920.1 hypothetical protein [Haloferax volcanii]MBS8124958.1 hypothetical protein [Haloferax volcanii]MBS8128455.1 hypothetical protein [Haloferax volcanii]
MSQRNLLGGTVVFAVALGLILVGAAVAPYAVQLGGSDSADTQNAAKQAFDADELVATPGPESGEVTMDSNAASKTVLIDVGHGNDVSESDVQPLVDALVANGHQVKYLTREDAQRNFNGSLRKADAFVVVNPEQPYTGGQLAGLRSFEDAGGRVALLGDPQSAGTTSILGLITVSVSSGTTGGDAGLTSDYGVSFGSTSLYNMHDYYLNYENVYATPEGDTALTEGVDEVVFRDAAPLSISADSVSPALVSGGETRVESIRKSGPYTVAAQSETVVAIGDADFLTPESAYEADNEVLVGNLADFLVSGDKESGAPAPATPESGAPGPGGSASGPAPGSAPTQGTTPTSA